jgi:hypothetical protein
MKVSCFSFSCVTIKHHLQYKMFIEQNRSRMVICMENKGEASNKLVN